MNFPPRVTIVEVAPRDGLQNEALAIPTETKIEFINQLSASGLSCIEATAFVSPKWVPQMADNAEVMNSITRAPNVRYPVLVPNLKGLEQAIACDVKEIAVFAAASESFSQKNINCSIAESLERFQPVMTKAREAGIRVRGYISCVLGCPYEGDVPVTAVSDVAQKLYTAGCEEISLGDTIGIGTPLRTQKMFEAVSKYVPIEHLAGHFHDTYGQALANILASMELGVAVFDTSTAGLGGCPYAKGASGNVATEDVLFMLHGMGIETGVDLDRVATAGRYISEVLGKDPVSRVGQVLMNR